MGFRELSTNWNLSAFASLREENSIYSVSTIDDKTGSVVLKKNCKIGSHSTIMPGVTVGENTIIGAHSFVNRCGGGWRSGKKSHAKTLRRKEIKGPNMRVKEKIIG